MKNLLYQLSIFWGKLTLKQRLIFIGFLLILGVIGNCSNPNPRVTNTENIEPSPAPVVTSTPTPTPTPTPKKTPEINPAFRLDNTISQNSDSKPSSIPSNVRADCRMRVNQDLKFPETAKHAIHEPTFNEANNSWEYRSNVVSSNNLGGEVQTEYYCMYDDATGEMSILYGE